MSDGEDLDTYMYARPRDYATNHKAPTHETRLCVVGNTCLFTSFSLAILWPMSYKLSGWPRRNV